MKPTNFTSYFTFANMQTPIGKERLSIILKLFRSYYTPEEIIDLHLDFKFYKEQLEEKPDARYMVFGMTEDDQFGFGIYDKVEIAVGKEVSKDNGYAHEYVPIDRFIFLLVSFLTLKHANKLEQKNQS